MRTTIQPLFKWAGSKQRLLDQYEPHFFPPTPPTHFVDLFCGGLTTTLWVAERYPDCRLTINDVNAELMLMYGELRDNTAAVVGAWREHADIWLALTHEGRKKYYYALREAYCELPSKASSTALASALLFMLQVNFNGMWKAYIKCNKRYSTPPGMCNQTAKFFNERTLLDVASVLQRCTILSRDFEQVVLAPGDFVYADPPYRDSVVEYQGGFSEWDQGRLAAALVRHTGPWAYSNKATGDSFYTRHFPGANIIPITATYTAGRGTSTHHVGEVLITNFSSPVNQL